jgi:hypothetical protein
MQCPWILQPSPAQTEAIVTLLYQFLSAHLHDMMMLCGWQVFGAELVNNPERNLQP